MNDDAKLRMKSLRAHAVSDAGVDVSGFQITAVIIKEHLHPNDAINALLDPSDPQDTCLAFELLKALAELPDAPSGSAPSFCRAREALKTFGGLAFEE
ncbi:hypothetical protein K438DRAFT_1799133 [Mycena galopus ATCC 62051]|nr:hypothetical protein K438DRAFT_1799133 [Mycena galopus ATCC 62051]